MMLQPMINPLLFSKEEISNGGSDFSQFSGVNTPVDSSDIMDLRGVYILFDFSQKAHKEFIQQQNQFSTRCASSRFGILGFHVPQKPRSERATKRNPKIWEFKISGNKGKPLKSAIKGIDSEILFSDLGLNRYRKSLKRCRESGGEIDDTGLKNPKRQKNGIENLVEWGLLPPPEMPVEFKDLIQEMGGSEERLLMQKIMYKTDLSSRHNRLQIPVNQVAVDDFLTDNERRKLGKGDGMNVVLVEPNGKISTIHFKRWNMGNSMVYVFNEQWRSVVEGNKTLKQNSVVQIWSFRKSPEYKLCFAMVTVIEGHDD